MHSQQPIKNIVILAHPDDETLGCFSIMNRNDTYCLIICNESERFKITQELYPNLKNRLECLGLVPGSLSLVNSFELGDMIYEKVKPFFNSDVRVFTHHPDDLHIDHKIISNTVRVVFRPERVDVKALMFCFTTNNNNFKANYFIRYNIAYKRDLLNFYIVNKSLNPKDSELNLDFNISLSKRYYNNTNSNSREHPVFEPFEISFLKELKY